MHAPHVLEAASGEPHARAGDEVVVEENFPAAVLAIGSLDVPVYYRARTYGTTQIRRFRDGVELLRMVITGFFDIKMGRVP